ncbi:MAG: hypothetical protein PF569_08870 [Candidatus Woesearchaeota archaeon]|jgi:uncharacterized membrane protein YraQ (UPF0718 family)|nr:hypothetical protein [Candidatus Woesearchaeota archaeon]
MNNNTVKKIKKVSIKNFKGIVNLLPILLGVILLISIVNSLVPQDFYSKILTGNSFYDVLMLDFFGSVLAGNPITAYMISEELMNNSVSLFLITAFILAWTTVGVVQFPAESVLMGKKFAVTRNIVAFVFAIIVSYLTFLIYEVIFL